MQSLLNRGYLRWVAWVSAGLILLGAGFFWQYLINEQSAALNRALNQELIKIRSGVEKEMKHRISEVDRMADRFVTNGKVLSKEEWEKDAAAFLKKFPEIRGISYSDTDLKIRWGLPEGIHKGYLNSALDWDIRRKSSIEKAIHARGAIVTPTLRLRNGPRGFGIFAPIYEGNKFMGIISAGAGYEVALKEWILRTLSPGYSVSVQGDAGDLFNNEPIADPKHPEVGQLGEIQFLGVRWNIWVQPTAEKYAEYFTSAPNWALFPGILISLACVFLGFLFKPISNREALAV